MLAAAIGVSSNEATLLLQSTPRLFSSCLCSCFAGITSAPCLTRSSALARDGGMTLSSYSAVRCIAGRAGSVRFGFDASQARLQKTQKRMVARYLKILK